ncbi:hypothetical protein JG687_00006319 [Phytophthora cactorum]|uniref:Uncharacterized protein n=1 Tax=Phytophthora cactorum TaxID=29920 RepID=A0A329SD90_9STRA|nr:hypothetical protein Pcac1_g5379 [Phytophthora cactorum]KAG2811365.1 hypothetical protein PC111_g15266 [Phytophthora cactorum]KAG2891204.1 hypothetical protein PC114_g17090 [Phytophthora cactorum]KAG2920359.1 hypothetical protein PC117_g16501 [Phytophthora cactorum]KAG3002009.1 hypothetical protein PC119_g16507 [Phytophthora cactorum]
MLDLVPYMLALPVMSSLSHSLRAMCLLAMVRHYTWPTWLLHGLPALPALARQGPLTLPSSPIRQEHQSHRSDCEYRKTTVATTTVVCLQERRLQNAGYSSGKGHGYYYTPDGGNYGYGYGDGTICRTITI